MKEIFSILKFLLDVSRLDAGFQRWNKKVLNTSLLMFIVTSLMFSCNEMSFSKLTFVRQFNCLPKFEGEQIIFEIFEVQQDFQIRCLTCFNGFNL